MGEYITTVGTFRFEQDGRDLIVTDNEIGGFREEFDWNDKWDHRSRQEMRQIFYTEFYTQLLSLRESYENRNL